MELNFTSNESSLFHLEYYFWSMIKGIDMSEDLQHKARICFHEAVTNAVTHGNKLNSEKQIFIQRELIDSKLIFNIKDEGSGFEYSEIKNPLSLENIDSPHGRGLLLVNEMACQSSYCNESKTMRLEFSLNTKTSNV